MPSPTRYIAKSRIPQQRLCGDRAHLFRGRRRRFLCPQSGVRLRSPYLQHRLLLRFLNNLQHRFRFLRRPGRLCSTAGHHPEHLSALRAVFLAERHLHPVADLDRQIPDKIGKRALHVAPVACAQAHNTIGIQRLHAHLRHIGLLSFYRFVFHARTLFSSILRRIDVSVKQKKKSKKSDFFFSDRKLSLGVIITPFNIVLYLLTNPYIMRLCKQYCITKFYNLQ